MNKIRILAAIVDTVALTMYKEDGTTIVIQQGDPRLRPIVDSVIPQIEQNNWADLDEYLINPPEANPYKEFENESGVVKFFKMAKVKLKEFMDLVGDLEKEALTVKPISVGSVPQTKQEIRTSLGVVDEIIKHAVPVSSSNFNQDNLHKQRVIAEDDGTTPNDHPDDTQPETIIAVVDGKVIPGMENIKSQFANAAKLGSTIGVENFLRRLGTVIDQRSHSVEDLLKFMERGDLPIADDGSILIYKILRRHVSEKGKYRDCHTGNVPQWVGAYVCMDESLVDHNRNNECSNGLHVARRGYINSFSGDVCVMAKLAPEDVITVPAYDANKMRVCGYHIIAELNDAMYSKLKANKPITDDSNGKILLGKAIHGDHIGRTHEVRITAQRGGGVVTKEYTERKDIVPLDKVHEVEALTDPDKIISDAPTDPKEVLQKVQQVSRKDQAKKLYDDWQAADHMDQPATLQKLMDFKKAAKVGWDKLGIPDPNIIMQKAKKSRPMPKPGQAINYASKSAKSDAIAEKHTLANDVAMGIGSPAERIKKLLAIGLNKQTAQQIVDIKRKAKKSWEALGVDATKAALIQDKAGK